MAEHYKAELAHALADRAELLARIEGLEGGRDHYRLAWQNLRSVILKTLEGWEYRASILRRERASTVEWAVLEERAAQLRELLGVAQLRELLGKEK